MTKPDVIFFNVKKGIATQNASVVVRIHQENKFIIATS